MAAHGNSGTTQEIQFHVCAGRNHLSNHNSVSDRMDQFFFLPSGDLELASDNIDPDRGRRSTDFPSYGSFVVPSQRRGSRTPGPSLTAISEIGNAGRNSVGGRAVSTPTIIASMLKASRKQAV